MRKVNEGYSVHSAIACDSRHQSQEFAQITAEVLADFAADNVKYVELRTTPRALADADIEGYVRAVLGVFEQFERDGCLAPFPQLSALVARVKARPRIAAYLTSERYARTDKFGPL